MTGAGDRISIGDGAETGALMSGNKLSDVLPWDLVADGYASEIVPVFNQWAMDSIDRVRPGKDDVVIDVATGPGTVALLLAGRVKQVVALDFSMEMIARLDREIKNRHIGNILSKVCDCQELPYASHSFDLAFSQFGLMFFPDRVRGFREMHRVLKAGGKAAVYSWAPISQSTAMTMMMGALFAGFPEARPKENEAKTIVHGLDDLDTFRSEMGMAGFKNISIEPVTHAFPLLDPDALWISMVKGSAPVTLMKNHTAAEIWQEKEKACIQYIRDHQSDVPLTSTAYLAIGVK